MAFLSPAPMEIVVILVIALLVLGPSRLPETARSLGRGFRELRDALQASGEEESEKVVEEAVDYRRATPPRPGYAEAGPYDDDLPIEPLPAEEPTETLAPQEPSERPNDA